MALPENFDGFEHLQDMLRRNHNRLVREYFSDVGDENWEPDLSSPRKQLRVAATMLDNDTDVMTMMRLYFFYDILGFNRAGLAQIFGRDDSVDTPVVGHPKIVLYFSQDAASVPDNEKPVEAEFSFRLMNETQATFAPANARTLATEIKRLFISGSKGIIITKGKNQYIYYHKEKGYRLRIYGSNKTDAIELIKKLLDLTNTTYDDDRLSVATPERSNTANPGTHLVYGETVKKRRFRPSANVRFRYAYATIPGKVKPVFLVDTSYRHASIINL